MQQAAKLEAREVQCSCGHTMVLEKKKGYCDKCARPVFYHAKDRRSHKLNNLYVLVLAVTILTFLTYVFLYMVELLGGA